MITSVSALRVSEYPAPERASRSEGRATGATGRSGEALSEEDRDKVEKLKARDREVRTHEQAHLSAGAGLITRGASYTYQTGPDGQQYAVGGEVGIDVSAVPNDPAATLRKAEQIRRAALAPSDPSGQDRAVAAEASRLAAEARQELARQSYGASSQSGAATSTFLKIA